MSLCFVFPIGEWECHLIQCKHTECRISTGGGGTRWRLPVVPATATADRGCAAPTVTRLGAAGAPQPAWFETARFSTVLVARRARGCLCDVEGSLRRCPDLTGRHLFRRLFSTVTALSPRFLLLQASQQFLHPLTV